MLSFSIRPLVVLNDIDSRVTMMLSSTVFDFFIAPEFLARNCHVIFFLLVRVLHPVVLTSGSRCLYGKVVGRKLVIPYSNIKYVRT